MKIIQKIALFSLGAVVMTIVSDVDTSLILNLRKASSRLSSDYHNQDHQVMHTFYKRLMSPSGI
jgi:hypothetical protein